MSSKDIISAIIESTARFYKIPKYKILGKRRDAEIVNARHTAMMLSRRFTNLPLDDIAEQFNRKDHGTIINAVRQVEKKCENLHTGKLKEVITITKKISKIIKSQ